MRNRRTCRGIRQRQAIETFARYAGFELVGEFYDQAVSGADPIDGRPGFKALLERIVGKGANTVIAEDASRFARTLMVHEAGTAICAGLGVPGMTFRAKDSTTAR